MMKRCSVPSAAPLVGKIMSLVLVMALLLPVMTMARASAPSSHLGLRAQPVLLQMAQQRPDEVFGVIVQKTSTGDGVENKVAELGGTVTDDLYIIRAFAARLPGKAVLDLARTEGVRWVSLDAPVEESACAQCVDTTKLQNAYIRTIGADKVWNSSPYLQGQGMTVAVLDSGINPQQDLYTVMGVNRLIAAVNFNGGYNQSVYDGYGHGNHVAGIIGGNGSRSSGSYIGVAPMANLVNVKVSDDQGVSTASNVVKGLQWINDNRTRYNIRVVNISLNSTTPQSYNTDPINAAVEILWFNKIVVVVSAGNRQGTVYAPANDPFVITVGAADDKGTNNISDDVIASFSGYGTTIQNIVKPDLVAPGTRIVALMANTNSALALAHPSNVINGIYFRMSGTSMAAPMVSGAVALLLQDEPGLTPDQVKYRLKATANKSWAGYNATKAGAGYLDVYAAVKGTTTQSANTGLPASHLLWTGGTPVTWNSVQWDSVQWDSVQWDSVQWDSVQWDSVQWDSDYWGQ